MSGAYAERMNVPQSWSAEAFNQAPESENRIHSDEFAKEYGFRDTIGVLVTATPQFIQGTLPELLSTPKPRGR